MSEQNHLGYAVQCYDMLERKWGDWLWYDKKVDAISEMHRRQIEKPEYAWRVINRNRDKQQGI